MSDIVVCAPVEWDHTADSILVDGACGHQVWAAPAGQRLLADGYEAHCVPCAIPLMDQDVDIEPAPGVLADVERDQGEWGRFRMEAFMKSVGITPNG